MNLIITWTAPVPLPDCGFIINYRRNYDSTYTAISTSGTTSGNTYSVEVEAAACFEGYIQSNCCSDNLSINTGFGVNSYQPLTIDATIMDTQITDTGTSEFPNPYDVVVSGDAYITTLGVPSTVPVSGTYPAGSTEYVIFETTAPFTVLNGFTVNSIVPVFDQGGALQQYDSVNTPPYFQFYWDQNTSGTTWNGSPLDLPSFILREFNITTQSPGGDVLAGNLLISWIAPPQYGGDDSEYNEVILNVYDSTSAFMGSATIYPTRGFVQATISIEKGVDTIGPGTEFTMTSQWGDGTVTATKLFYLPLF